MMNICSRISQVCVKDGLITIAREQMGHFISHCLFVCAEAKRPSQQFFSHVGTEQTLPGFNQYVFCSRTQHDDDCGD